MTILRYRKARDTSDRLGQIFTPQPIAKLLVASLPVTHNSIRHVIDLGAGNGALALAVIESHKDATALLVEIDPQYVKSLLNSMPSHISVIEANALDSSWKLNSTPDLIVSNPPYGAISLTSELKKTLIESGLDVPFNGKWARGDAAFTARAWSISKQGVNLGLIVASPMIRDSAYRPLREKLVSQLKELCVTKLDEYTFPNVEVRAFLLTGQRAINRRRKVLLRKSSIDGTIIDEMEVSWNKAVVNLDIDYHRTLERLGLTGKSAIETLGSIGVSIARGSRSQKEFERLGLPAFHTTDFSEHESDIVLNGAYHGYKIARPGDILIPRVGSRCLIKQARVREGEGLFTDCIFRLSVPRRAHTNVWKTISSAFGAEWRLANASGNCAKHLTIQALLGMPLLS
jgi:predicted RNA methylase